MKILMSILFISVLLLIAGLMPAHAGGLWLYEEATPSMGVGGNGRLKYDATDVGYGYNLGVLFELSPQTRL